MATTALTPAATAYRSGLYEWLTTTDHKKIGILYLINSMVFFFVGGMLALGVRSELAVPGIQFFKEDVYNQLFTMHASFMLFLFVIPILAGFGNYVVPLMIGAPDMAFPRINALSFLDAAARGHPDGHRLPGWRRGGRRLDVLRATVRDQVLRHRDGPVDRRGRPDRDEFDSGRHQLPRDHLQDARAGHDHVPHAHPGVDGAGDEHPGGPRDTGSSQAP
jgi:hypothetical protein